MNLIFLRVISFCLKKFERNRFSRRAPYNPSVRLQLKYQICEGSFPEKSQVKENGQTIEKLTILRAITFCVKKICGLAAYACELPTTCSNY